MPTTDPAPGTTVPPAPVTPPVPPTPPSVPAVPPDAAASPAPVAPAAVPPVTPDPPAPPAVPVPLALTVPEGAEAFIDATDIAQITAAATAKGWTPAAAQAALEEFADARAAESAAFRAVTEADPTYGGTKLAETQRLAELALDTVRPVGTPRGDALRAILRRSGYANNLEIVSFLADLGATMAEDSPHAPGSPGRSSAPNRRDPATVLYGETPG